MDELKLIKSESFGNVECDFYGDGRETWMTREQIGVALEYSDPRVAIAKIHAKRKDRLDRFSVVTKLVSTDGKSYNTTLYNRKGIMEICRHSDQPKADAFMDFCWEVMDSLMTGKTKLVGMTEYQQMMAETRRKNARVQSARILTQLAKQYHGTTYEQVLNAHATKELTGEYLLPLPRLETKTYSAGEIGEILGISGNKVGAIANQNGLKNDKYGQWFKDKAKWSNKEVPAFRYYDNVIPVLRKILDQEKI